MNPVRILLFDGVCNLCNRAVQFVIRHDRKQKFQFASLQGATGQRLLKEYNLPHTHLFSFILIDNDKAYTKSSAALRVCRHLNTPVNWLYGLIVIPAFIRDAVYNLVAKKRYKWFGKTDECRTPTPLLQKRFLD